jgi:hypothetical protein
VAQLKKNDSNRQLSEQSFIENEEDWLSVMAMLDHAACGITSSPYPNRTAAYHIRCAIKAIRDATPVRQLTRAHESRAATTRRVNQ